VNVLDVGNVDDFGSTQLGVFRRESKTDRHDIDAKQSCISMGGEDNLENQVRTVIFNSFLCGSSSIISVLSANPAILDAIAYARRWQSYYPSNDHKPYNAPVWSFLTSPRPRPPSALPLYTSSHQFVSREQPFPGEARSTPFQGNRNTPLPTQVFSVGKN